MPFVHSVFTFRKPSDTADLNDVLQRLEALPGLAAAGDPLGRDYLDHFKTGDEVSVSLVFPTGKAARVHSSLITGMIEAAGGTVEVHSAVIVEPERQPEQQIEWGATANDMISRIQTWGRTTRVGNQRAVPFEPAPSQDIAEMDQGGVVLTTISSLVARSEAATAWLNSREGVFFDEETVIKTEDASAPQAAAPKF